MPLSDAHRARYARHIQLPQIGEDGQRRLVESSCLIIGMGGLGSPAAMYLAAAGVGELTLVDYARVELSNLQRQIVHTTESVDMAKVESAAATIAAINPEIRFNAHNIKLTAENATSLIAEYDVIADGSDNFDTRYLVNDTCFFLKKTLVSGALLRFEGQLSVFKPHAGDGHPCYRCLFPSPPPPGMTPRCETAGIFGAIAGVVGTMQASEVLKELLGLGQSLSGSLLLYDALNTTFRKIKINADPGCPLCGDQPSILPPAIT